MAADAMMGCVAPAIGCVELGLLVVAAVLDARERRLPNALAAALCTVCALGTWWEGAGYPPVAHPGAGFSLLSRRACVAVLICGALVAFEAAWRRVRGTAGLGMGDVKLLAALLVRSPAAALCSFAGGLFLLAVCCLATRRRSLPLLPFWVPLFLALRVSGTLP